MLRLRRARAKGLALGRYGDTTRHGEGLGRFTPTQENIRLQQVHLEHLRAFYFFQEHLELCRKAALQAPSVSFCLPRARTTGSTMLEILLAYHAIWPLAMGAALGVLNAVPSVAEGETAGYRSSRIRLTRTASRNTAALLTRLSSAMSENRRNTSMKLTAIDEAPRRGSIGIDQTRTTPTGRHSLWRNRYGGRHLQ